MILVDVNLLLYTQNTEASQHSEAKTWWADRLNSPDRVGLPWATLVGFVRLASNRRVFPNAVPVMDAWAVARGWLDVDGVWIPGPTARHEEILERCLAETNSQAKLVHDAHLAALAIEHGLILCSADRGFARFSDLRWENPVPN